MSLFLAFFASAEAGCADLGEACAPLKTGYWNQCQIAYNQGWLAPEVIGEVDSAGTALSGFTFGEVCPKSCSEAELSTQIGASTGEKITCEGFQNPGLVYDGTTTPAPERPTFILEDGTKVFAECTPKAALSDSIEAIHKANCVKDDVLYNEHKCNQYQQYCDWTYTGFPKSSEYKRLPEHELFAETANCDPSKDQCPQVDPSRYSANFGLFKPQKKDFNWHALDKNGDPLEPRPSKWVMWHYDTLTSPPFTLPKCDCLASEKVEGPEGWFTNADCDDICKRDAIGDPNKLSKVITVHDKVCHREVDVDGVRWDPSPNMNYLTPLNKLFPTRFGPGQDCEGPDCKPGLNMQRGEGGNSWYWWGHAKNSWNDNDQTSHVGPGELNFDSEHECKKYAETYWDVKDMNIEFQSVCEHFSSKNQCANDSGAMQVTNATCRAACDSTITDFDGFFQAEGLINSNGVATDQLGPWFRDNCVYTPYQPENDHAWPNFHVPDSNQCFGQWQIGFEDQGCDACMHPGYDNSEAFNGGWSYSPLEGFGVSASTEGYGNCSAQCGKIIMDGPGHPKDVTSAQECQQYCQDDPSCAHFQWRPIPDWNKASEGAWAANKLNQVRSCLLKNDAQVEGALRARWGADGEWIWHPSEDGHAFANEFQNNDCAQGQTGEAHNWCLGCEDTDGQITYHSWKWRNNMISGPKFCDSEKLAHGSTDREESPYWNGVQKVSKCPAYDNKGRENPVESDLPTMVDADGTPTVTYCKAKEGLDGLNGSEMWAEHCEAANRMGTESTKQRHCNRFQQYCEWVMDFRMPSEDYKNLTEAEMGIAPSQVDTSNWSNSFGLNPPCQDVCTPDEEAALNPATAGVCIPPETCDQFPDSIGGYTNDSGKRTGGWVFYHHEKLGSLSLVGCDCLVDPTCSPQCARIAEDADILQMYFLADRVCHREEDVAATRWDPSPNMISMTDVFEAEWGSLGMTGGESGSSWYWYGATKPSWNNWDQTSHVGAGEKVFETEADCRAFASQYWNSLGYPEFDSVCSQMSSKTAGISNAACQEACDGSQNQFADFFAGISNVSAWFKQHCEYTPYHAENDHVWPNVYVPDANECFAQWQIGYEDQGCDGCMHRQYNNTADFDFGWSYAPVEGSGIPEDATGHEDDIMGVWNRGHCNAQCGKVIANDDGSFVDVTSAQKCQQYCQDDSRCAAWQWRWSPDYTAAASVDKNDYENENNRVNKVRSCLLKSVDQVVGALDARWNEAGAFVGGSSPDWDGVSQWEAEANYNAFSAGQYLIDDSQNSQSDEGNNWYLECNSAEGKTTHSLKWRNNMVSGPKYCGSQGTGRISHGANIPASAFLSAKSTIAACPTEAQVSFAVDHVAAAPSNPGAADTAWPNLSGVPEKQPPVYPEPAQPWNKPSETMPGVNPAGEACDIMGHKFCEGSAWEGACLNAINGTDEMVAGCPIQCAARVNRTIPGNDHILTAFEWQEKLGEHYPAYSVENCSYDVFPYVTLATTSTTSTTMPYAKSCQYTTTSTTTTTLEYIPWEPSCPDAFTGSVDADCHTGAAGEADWAGYVPTIVASRDGQYSVDKNAGTVNVTAPMPVPSWCKTSSSELQIPQAGVHDAHDFYNMIGKVKLQCVGWTVNKHEAARARSLGEANCDEEAVEVFSYESLSKAVGYFPDFIGFDNLQQNELDLASFLANTGAETTGGSKNSIVGFAWCFASEQSKDGTRYGNQDTISSCGPCNDWGYTQKVGTVTDKSPDNWGYYGRGALQLTYAYNYGAFQTWAEKNLAYKNSDVDFLTNPGKVASSDFGFAGSLWFFMSPARMNEKPSMHNVVEGWVKNGALVTAENMNVDNAGRAGDFGYQFNILNGGLECSGRSHPGPGKRISYFSSFLGQIGFEGELDSINSVCRGCTMAPSIVGRDSFLFWYDPVSGAATSGDTANTCSGEISVTPGSNGGDSVTPAPVTEAPTTKAKQCECIPIMPWDPNSPCDEVCV